jgi:hypothetical protein
MFSAGCDSQGAKRSIPNNVKGSEGVPSSNGMPGGDDNDDKDVIKKVNKGDIIEFGTKKEAKYCL